MPMPNPPLITIITPSFNQAGFIRQTIESVIGQDYPRVEYLIFDGGSTDGSVEIIRSYENRVTTWVSRKDRGQSDAINQGLRQAQGEIVGWLNSDDYLLPGALATVARHFGENPQSKWAIGACELLHDRNPPHAIRHAPENLSLKNILAWWPDYWFCQQATFWRRSLLDEAGFLDESLDLLMDCELWLRFFAVQPPTRIPQTLAGYRYHKAAKTIAATNEPVLEGIKVLRKIRAAKAGELLAVYREESVDSLLQLCDRLAARKFKARNLSTRELIAECGRRMVQAPEKLLRRRR